MCSEAARVVTECKGQVQTVWQSVVNNFICEVVTNNVRWVADMAIQLVRVGETPNKRIGESEEQVKQSISRPLHIAYQGVVHAQTQQHENIDQTYKGKQCCGRIKEGDVGSIV